MTRALGAIALIVAGAALASHAVAEFERNEGQECHATAASSAAKMTQAGQQDDQICTAGEALLQRTQRRTKLSVDELGSAGIAGNVTAEGNSSREALPEDVAIVVYADERFASKYRTNLDLMTCYAKKHNYIFELFKPDDCNVIAPNCTSLKDAFFRKHCCVAGYLELQRSKGRKRSVFVLDADVTVAVMNRGLDEWIKGSRDSDIVFYEREFGGEIAAGNYMVRPTQYAIDFLSAWSQWEHHRPSGFSSGDNGPLHLMLQSAFNRGDVKIHTPHYTYSQCKYTFDHLKANVNHLTEYYDFISCTRKSIGTAKQVFSPGGSSIMVLPRYFAWVSDWQVSGGKACELLGPVLHHGVKSQKGQDEYAKGSSPGHCQQDQERLVNASKFKELAGAWERYMEGSWKTSAWRHVRHESLTHCIESWSCADWAA